MGAADMAALPPPLAAVLAVTPRQTMIMCSDNLSPEESRAAVVMACTKALSGAVVAVVKQEELEKVLRQATEAQEQAHLVELAQAFELAEILANQ
jgi:hypothetical protein